MFFFFQAEDGIRDDLVTGVQTCALPISIPAGAKTPGACSPKSCPLAKCRLEQSSITRGSKRQASLPLPEWHCRVWYGSSGDRKGRGEGKGGDLGGGRII